MALESEVRNDRLKMVSWYHGNDVEPTNKTQTKKNKSDAMRCDAVRAQQTNSKTRKEGVNDTQDHISFSASALLAATSSGLTTFLSASLACINPSMLMAWFVIEWLMYV